MATETLSLRPPMTLLRDTAMTITLGLVQSYRSALPLEAQELFILRWAAVPMEVMEATDLEPRVPFPIAGTLVTSIFLHAGWPHLAGNLLLLALFAPGQAAELVAAFGRLAWIEGGIAIWSHAVGLAVGLIANLVATRRPM